MTHDTCNSSLHHGHLLIYLQLQELLSFGVGFGPLDGHEQFPGLDVAQPQPGVEHDLPVGVRHKAVREQAVVGAGGHLSELGLPSRELECTPQLRRCGHRLQVEKGVAHLVVGLESVPVEHLLARAKDQAGRFS